MLLYAHAHYRKAWIALGDMTKLDSQLEIIKLLETVDSQMKETVLERWRAKQSKEEKDKSRCVGSDIIFSCLSRNKQDSL